MTDSPTAKPKPLWLRLLVWLAGIMVLVGGVYGYYQYKYPYGYSHHCDKQLYFALYNYADLREQEFQYYWPDADRSNIEQITRDRVVKFVTDQRDRGITNG